MRSTLDLATMTWMLTWTRRATELGELGAASRSGCSATVYATVELCR